MAKFKNIKRPLGINLTDDGVKSDLRKTRVDKPRIVSVPPKRPNLIVKEKPRVQNEAIVDRQYGRPRRIGTFVAILTLLVVLQVGLLLTLLFLSPSLLR